MRALLAWIFTLTAGFAAFLGLATLVLLPIQATKNRATFAVVDRYAHELAASSTPPTNASVDDAFASNTEGIRIWRSLPSGCYNTAFEASSDRFVLGFWENGNSGRFNSIWWHCYAYPSGKTTLKLSVKDYLASSVGLQLVAYILTAAVAGLFAWALRAQIDRRLLRPWTKALWFGAFMTITELFYSLQDLGDDEFFKNPESIKWFVFAYDKTIGSLLRFVDSLPITFAIWIIAGWTAGQLISFAKSKLAGCSVGDLS